MYLFDGWSCVSGKMSRDKGKRGEREVAKILTEAGFPASRGAQHRGGPGSPDVLCVSIPDFHFEVKNVEGGNPYKWLRQCAVDAHASSISDNNYVGKVPVVVHKRNHEDWIAILDFKSFLGILSHMVNTN